MAVQGSDMGFLGDDVVDLLYRAYAILEMFFFPSYT